MGDCQYGTVSFDEVVDLIFIISIGEGAILYVRPNFWVCISDMSFLLLGNPWGENSFGQLLEYEATFGNIKIGFFGKRHKL